MSSNHGRLPIFIGSSTEALDIARQFAAALEDELVPLLWKEPGLFPPSDFVLIELERKLEQFPVALFVLSPDELTKSRGDEMFAPRDNVIFELGLFIGRHSRSSVIIAIPDSVPVKLPSDIVGLQTVTYHAHGFDGLPR